MQKEKPFALPFSLRYLFLPSFSFLLFLSYLYLNVQTKEFAYYALLMAAFILFAEILFCCLVLNESGALNKKRKKAKASEKRQKRIKDKRGTLTQCYCHLASYFPCRACLSTASAARDAVRISPNVEQSSQSLKSI